MFRKIKINFKRGKNMTLLNKIITRYMLIATVILSSGYIVKLYGAEDFPEVVKTNGAKDFLALQWGLSVREGRRMDYRAQTKESNFMEDRHTAQTIGRFSFFGVYDGHGGIAAADYAKKYLAENFFKAQGTIKKRLFRAFLKTDKDFLEDPQFKEDDSGTTAVVAVIDAIKKELYIANAGDSRAMLICNGQVSMVTKDHKPEEEKERIEEAGGYVSGGQASNFSGGNLAVSRAIGDRNFKDFGVIPNPEVYERFFGKDDVLILACDGLFDVMRNEEVAKFVYEQFNKNKIDEEDLTEEQVLKEGAEREEEVEEAGDEQIKLIARKLRDEAYAKGSMDNISVLIVKFGSLLRAGSNELSKAAESLKGKLKKKID